MNKSIQFRVDDSNTALYILTVNIFGKAYLKLHTKLRYKAYNFNEQIEKALIYNINE